MFICRLLYECDKQLKRRSCGFHKREAQCLVSVDEKFYNKNRRGSPQVAGSSFKLGGNNLCIFDFNVKRNGSIIIYY